MICNTRNWSNDTTESQEEQKACFYAHRVSHNVES